MPPWKDSAEDARDWSSSTNIHARIQIANGYKWFSFRKRRLIICRFVREILHFMRAGPLEIWDVIEQAEEAVDSEVAHKMLMPHMDDLRYKYPIRHRLGVALEEALRVFDSAPTPENVLSAAERATNFLSAEVSHTMQRIVIDEILGNPFMVVAFASELQAWRTPDVIHMAKSIYSQRDWPSMLILRDALEDAGCRNKMIMGHFQQTHHCRGCWVLDLILGKE